MKKKFVIISIIIFIILAGLYLFGYYKLNNKSKKEKNINFDLKSLVSYIEKDDNYLLTANYYQLDIKTTKKKITVSFKNNEHSGKLIGKLSNDILSFKISNNDKNALLKANIIYSIVDSLGQINGNDKGYVSALLSDYDLEGATIEKDGIELISEDNTNIYQFKVNKKFKLGKIENSYLKPDDLQDVKNNFTNEENLQKTKGNIIVYKDTDFYKNNNLYICEPVNLSTRSYNTLISIIELVYGSEYKQKFIEAYPKLESKKVLDKFDVLVDYQAKDTDVIKKIITNNYKILKIAYKN